MNKEVFSGGQEDKNNASSEGSLVPSESRIESILVPEIDDLIKILSRPAGALTGEELDDSIRKRQEAVDRHLFRGGPEILTLLFERIKQIEAKQKQPIKIDLSMIEMSGKILSGLYLPAANLRRLIFTGSDLTGSNLQGANLTEAIAGGAILRGVTATAANFNSAVIPDADLSGGIFIGCSFINAHMENVRVDDHTNFAGCRFIGTYLGDTDLSIANTVGSVFRGIRR